MNYISYMLSPATVIEPIPYDNPEILAEAKRLGVTVEELLKMKDNIARNNKAVISDGHLGGRKGDSPKATTNLIEMLKANEEANKYNAVRAASGLLEMGMPSTYLGLITGASLPGVTSQENANLFEETRPIFDLISLGIAGAVKDGVKNVARNTVSKVSPVQRIPLKLQAFDSSMRNVGKTTDKDLKLIANLRKQANIKEIESAEELLRLRNLGYTDELAIDLMANMSESANAAPIKIKSKVNDVDLGQYDPNAHQVDLYNHGYGNVEDIANTVDHEWGGHASTRGIISKEEAKLFNVKNGENFAELLDRNQRLFGGENGFTDEVRGIIEKLGSGNTQEAISLAENHFGKSIKSEKDLLELLEYATNKQENRARMWASRMKLKLTGQTFDSQYSDPMLQNTDIGWLKKTYKLPALKNYFENFGEYAVPITTGTSYIKYINDEQQKKEHN